VGLNHFWRFTKHPASQGLTNAIVSAKKGRLVAWKAEEEVDMGSRKLPKGLTGVAGEYFVAAELSRRGYIASITLRNTRGVDILVSNPEATRQAAIQVKTSQGDKAKWILNEKAETFFSERFFYVFVNLKDPEERPDFYVVPSGKVAEYARESHKKWLEQEGKNHMDNPVRIFADEKREYLERWDLLGL
jgi:hypothetical protein